MEIVISNALNIDSEASKSLKPTMGSLKNQQGVILLGILVAVMILGLMSSIVATSWKSRVYRSKERELLWRGDQYRRAIESYYHSAQSGSQSSLPSALGDLVRDKRSIAVVRHLRQLYPDPFSGKDWLLIKDTSGKIIGVRSSSTLEPFKQGDFSEENKDFAGKKSYSEWRFVFTRQSSSN